MKILLKKLKRANKLFLVVFLITTLAYGFSFAFLTKSLLSLSGIETTLRIVFIIIFSILLLVYFIWNLINIILKRNKTFIITTILFLILSVIFSFGSFGIDFIYGKIDNIVCKEIKNLPPSSSYNLGMNQPYPWTNVGLSYVEYQLLNGSS